MLEENPWRIKALELLDVAEVSSDPEVRVHHQLAAVVLLELAGNATNPFAAVCTDCHWPNTRAVYCTDHGLSEAPAITAGSAHCVWRSRTHCGS